MRLSTTGELLDSDELGTVPTYTLATFFYASEANFKAKNPSRVVLQRMYLDVAKAGWYQLPDTQEISPDDKILAQFEAAMPNRTITDVRGLYAIVSYPCPLLYGNGNDWAIWAADRYSPKTPAAPR